ncbi:MAG: hypothetical protein ACQETP_10900, partial [Bacteroidota bacterium]
IQTGSVPEDMFRPLFIAVVMLFIGTGFLYTSVASYRREEAYAAAENLDEPWTAREAWQSSTLTHEPSLSLGFLTVVFLGGGGVLAGWVIWTAIITADTPEWPALFTLIFPLAGVFMAVHMAKAYKRRQRFGTSEAELETMPGRLGERFLAQVRARIDRDEFPEHGAQVQLSCYRRSARYETTGSGDNKSRTAKEKKQLLWRGEKQMNAMSYDADGAVIPASFEIPDELPESTAMKRSKKYLARTGKSDFMWVLTVRAELPGIDYRSRFEVPVYESEDKTSTNGTASASSQEEREAEDASEQSEKVMWDLERDEEALQVDSGEAEATTDDPYAEYIVEPNLTEPISKNISIERLGGRGIRVHMKPDRSLKGLGILAFLVVSGIGLTVGSVFVFSANILGGAVCLFFGIVCLWSAWATWNREVIISVSDGEVDIQTEGGAGQGGHFPATEVEDIKVLISGTESSSNYEIAVQKRAEGGLDSGTAEGVMDTMGQVFGKDATGKVKEKMVEAKNRVAHLDGLHNKQEADWIAEQLREAVEAEKRYA